MIIEKSLAKYVVFSDDALNHALQKINENKFGLVFVIAQNGTLEGVLTDGDFRRWLLKIDKLDLSQPALVAANREFISLSEYAKVDDIEKTFSDRIKFVPMTDRQNRLVSIACCEKNGILIGGYDISEETPCFIIAEIGNNHNGDIKTAFKLVDEAVLAGADCVKFQMRDMQSMYRQDVAGDVSDDLGAQYTLDLLAKFQLSNDEMIRVFDYCLQRQIIPLCTPWDISSLNALENYGMSAYKLASADLTNSDLLEALCKTQKPLICSTGMSTEAEIVEVVKTLKQHGAQYILLHCNSTYPAPFKDINLKYLARLKELGGGCIVGYSGHERGYSIPIAAVALGAKVIEKHLTLDRNMEGNDHRVSLLPDEFREMVREVRNVEAALGAAEARRITQGELMNREVLGKSILAAKSIMVGEIITSDHLSIRSPGKGLAPYHKRDLIGRASKRSMAAGDFFYPSDIRNDGVDARNYRFNRPFGIPIRYHDFLRMHGKSNFDLLEFHFSYKDLDVNPEEFLHARQYDVDFVIHSPELFAGDHIMDLASDDSEYRERSIAELQRVINITRSLKPYFPKTKRPLIIINAGGFSLDEFDPPESKSAKYNLIADALKFLDTEGVEIIPQTMPPFPWHFGGQRYHNLFMSADDIVDFCKKYETRICLDVSHSKLACNHSGTSFADFLDRVAPYAAHLHIVDAEGVDGEGLQIGEGGIDFSDLGKRMNLLCPNASFIPEVWQGHKNDGEGFWVALSRLEGNF